MNFNALSARTRDLDSTPRKRLLRPQLVVLFLRDLLSDRAGAGIDWVGPACMLALGVTGTFFIYSAGSYTGFEFSLNVYYFKQIVFLGLGFSLYLGISLVDYKHLLEYWAYIYALAIVLLLTLLTPLGVERSGAQRWLDFGVFLFQPSEAAKIAALVTVAAILTKSQMRTMRESLQWLVIVFVAISLPLVLIFLQPDLGTALVLLPMVFTLLYVSRLPFQFFSAALGLLVLALLAVSVDLYQYRQHFEENGLSFQEDKGAYEEHSILPLRDYQRNRILAFVDPDGVDPSGKNVSWNLRQSLISVGTGGLTGKGWREGTQAKLGYLPETVAHTDFIFSVVAEERGFLGGAFIILLYAVLILNNIRIAGLSKDRFGTYLAMGVSAIFMVHIFVNIGMTIGIMPITGLPLPFLSYGGSFVLICCLLQGMVQSVYRYRKNYT